MHGHLNVKFEKGLRLNIYRRKDTIFIQFYTDLEILTQNSVSCQKKIYTDLQG